VVYLILRSRRGLALGAIRDHETAAASLGVDIYRIKLVVYIATAAFRRRAACKCAAFTGTGADADPPCGRELPAGSR
jgi:branched-subunit amino acid ABC-type transport system permease component